jgi:excisionase family DNA binding protein
MIPADPMTVAQVARRRKVSTDTVLGWIHSGELFATHEGTGKVRATYRVEEADLAAFLEGRRTAPKPTATRRGRPRQLPEVATATRYYR